MRPLAALAALALLAGCSTAQYAWTQPGVAPDQIRADQSDCRDLASHEAFRQSYYYPRPFFPLTGRGFYGRHSPFYEPFAYDPFFYRIERERDLTDFCMRSRGYRLERFG